MPRVHESLASGTARWAVPVAGMLVIAATYGMARFGVGLLSPRLVAERPGLASAVGTAAAAQFVSYAVAAAAAVRWGDRRPRLMLVLAGITATSGCAGVALASQPVAFVAAVFVGGTGAGLASPALVRVVDEVVEHRQAGTAHSVVNSGTAVGVVAAGGLAFATSSSAWAWGLMAAASASTAVLLLALVGRARGARPGPAVHGPAGRGPRRSVLAVPAAGALVAGAASSLVWSHGPLIAVVTGPVPAGHVGYLWMALGAGGLLGPVTGLVVARHGLRRAWTLCAIVVAAAHGALAMALALAAPWATYVSMALFGAGYMCLSGVLILWARALSPASAGSGTALLFIALAIGQALGSVGFDVVRSSTGAMGAVALAAALSLVGACVVPQAPRRRRPRTDRAPDRVVAVRGSISRGE